MTDLKKNPLEDKEWLKKFVENFKKDIKKSEEKKTSTCG